jgi:ribosomal protein S18 acetylase RimI-like enzyme
VPDDLTLLRRIDAYLDAVPRAAVRTEEIGPFTLFVQEGGGWRYYARPTPGTRTFTRGDVEAVRARQRELGQPEAIEWVVGLGPSVGSAAAAAGMTTRHLPLMHLPSGAVRPVAVPDGIQIGFADPDDDLATISAVAMVGFGNPGTEAGDVGVDALAEAAAVADPGITSFTRERMRAGTTVTAAAYVDGMPVSVGSHNPRGGVTEIVGVATLPAYRRRGIGAAVTAALTRDAIERGIGTICLSAGSPDVARVYARAGFREVGQVGAAEPPSA